MHFYWTFLTMAHWIRLSLLCRCKWTRKFQVSYENISEQYSFFMSIKMYQFSILSILNLFMYKNSVGMSKNLPVCLPYWKWKMIYVWSSTKVDRIHLAVNMALSLCHKYHKNNEIYIKQGYQQNRILFCIAIAYWPLSLRCGVNMPPQLLILR